MPERSLTIAAYAAGASLAAASLVYVFGPTFFLDEADAGKNSKKRLAIGLSNPGNDCFINSIIQALAGLPVLRLFLIHELHQRTVGGEKIYLHVSDAADEKDSKLEKTRPEWLQLSLQAGVLSSALKAMLDVLNERPISRKTVSASPFIVAVERAFKTRVSRNQQDAQEFLQLILERLADEHTAGVKVRQRAQESAETVAERTDGGNGISHLKIDDDEAEKHHRDQDELVEEHSKGEHEDEGEAILDNKHADSNDNKQFELPFLGKLSSIVECSVCHFKPKPSTTTFLTLTLHVPHGSTSTTLDACLDGLLKIEHIEDFRCDRCRLVHALQVTNRHLQRTTITTEQRSALQKAATSIEETIETDPEHPPAGLELPNINLAPRQRISRFTRISSFPKILAIHLSRSVWAAHSTSAKNLAKVSFPEELQLGTLLDRKSYRLMGIVSHRGSHSSGHYETFRRQVAVPQLSRIQDQRIERPATSDAKDESVQPSTTNSEALPDKSSLSSPIVSEEQDIAKPADTTAPIESTANTASDVEASQSFRDKTTMRAKEISRQQRAQERWWRISDDKVKECKLNDVLNMQREVYLLFYELTPP